jgi:hypothetical protein
MQDDDPAPLRVKAERVGVWRQSRKTPVRKELWLNRAAEWDDLAKKAERKRRRRPAI